MIRRKTVALLSFPLLAVGLALGAGCSSDDSKDNGNGDGDGDDDLDYAYTFCGPADTCPPSTEGVDFDTPVSFTDDIYNAFLVSSCGGGSGCHDTATFTGIAFGDEENPLDAEGISALITQLTTQKSPISDTLNVVPGDWTTSFMMQKLDGCQNKSGLSCDQSAESLALSVCDTACGDGMPASEGDTANPEAYPLSKAQRDLVRVWIQQGAKDN